MKKHNNRSISDNVGSRIKDRREEKGYSLLEVEGLTGISASYINRIENGSRKAPSVPILSNIAKNLDLDLPELLDLARGDKNVVISIVDLLLTNNLLINGREISKEVKAKFVILIKKILEAGWENEKHKEALEIMEMIESFKVEMAR